MQGRLKPTFSSSGSLSIDGCREWSIADDFMRWGHRYAPKHQEASKSMEAMQSMASTWRAATCANCPSAIAWITVTG